MAKKKNMEQKMYHTFDTYKYIKALVAKGMKEPQAEIIINSIADSREIELSHLATKEQVNALEQTTKEQINALDKKIDVSVARLETRISETQNSTLRWMLASMFTFTSIIIGVIIAAIKYMK